MKSSAAESQAFALLQADRLEEAEAAWRAILRANPGHVSAQHFLGCVLARSGRVDEALALIDRSIELEPRNSTFLANRARVLADAHRVERAIADLRRAVRWEPRFASAYHHLGLLLERVGRIEEALASLRRAVLLEPGGAGAWASLGRLLLSNGDAAGARDSLERALAARPADPDLLNNLGLALSALGLADLAAARFRQATELRPSFAEAYLNWGHALRVSGELRAAAAMYDRAVEARGGFREAMLARAGAALDLGELGDARALYGRVLELAPQSADARYGLGQVALRERRFAEGWAGYEWRFATRPPQAQARDSALPRLAAADLDRITRVLVWGEQGLGDQLLFSTLLPELEARGIEMELDLDPRLGPLLVPRLCGAALVANDVSASRSMRVDAQVPLGSLAALFRPDVASFVRQPRALLATDPARVASVAAAFPPGTWRIGVSWRSLRDGGRSGLARRKSAPLETFARLASIEARLIDLQYGDVGDERERFMSRHPGALLRVDGLDPMSELEGLMTVIEACDLVVTTSNVTAHLAGALGKRTLLVFPGGHPPFAYWVPDEKGRSLWYPSVRVVSAPDLDTWEKVLDRATELAQLEKREMGRGNSGWCC